MVSYKIAQRVETVTGYGEWIDILTLHDEAVAKGWVAKAKLQYPDAEIRLRSVVETELIL